MTALTSAPIAVLGHQQLSIRLHTVAHAAACAAGRLHCLNAALAWPD